MPISGFNSKSAKLHYLTATMEIMGSPLRSLSNGAFLHQRIESICPSQRICLSRSGIDDLCQSTIHNIFGSHSLPHRPVIPQSQTLYPTTRNSFLNKIINWVYINNPGCLSAYITLSSHTMCLIKYLLYGLMNP